MKYFLFFCCSLSFFFCRGQLPLDEKAYKDSLLKQTSAPSMVDRAKAHFELSYFYYALSDSLNAAKEFSIAQKLSGNNQLLKDLSVFYQASLFADYDRQKAMQLYKNADSVLSKYNELEVYSIRSKAWSEIARILQLNDDDNGFIETLTNKAMPLAQKAQSKKRIGKIYLDIGSGLYNMGQYPKSNEYFDKAIATVKDIKPVLTVLPDAYINMAKNYIMLQEYNQAGVILPKAYEVLKNFPNVIVAADYYRVNGMYLYKIKDYKNSLINLDKSIEVAKINKDYYLAEAAFTRKFNFYFEQKKYNQALHVLDELGKMEPTKSFLRNSLGRTYNYSRVYGAMGKYQNAYDSLNKFIDIYDSLENADVFKRTQELEAKFQVAEKEREIAVLEAEKKEAQLMHKTTRLTNLLLGIGCLLFLIIGIASYVFYQNNKKISAQKMQEITNKQQLAVTQALLEGEDRERQRMARDLHDGLGGMLAGVKINLSNQLKMENKNLDGIIYQLDESVAELRRISRNMMPESLVRFGLETSLRDLCESLNSERTHTDFQPINIKSDISLSTQIVIYRIIQEALSNAVRHANAKNILLQCSSNEDILYITIEDDGVGFNINEMQQRKGIGLSNIESRVKYLKGKLDIFSQPNEGTTLNIEVNVAAG